VLIDDIDSDVDVLEGQGVDTHVVSAHVGAAEDDVVNLRRKKEKNKNNKKKEYKLKNRRGKKKKRKSPRNRASHPNRSLEVS